MEDDDRRKMNVKDMQRRLMRAVLPVIIPAMTCGACAEDGWMEMGMTQEKALIVMDTGIPGMRSADPDENLVSDMNIFIFNSYGLLEEAVYLDSGQMLKEDGKYAYETVLLEGCRYSVYACANIGYRLQAETSEEIEDIRYHLVYPDDYRIGIPMSGKTLDMTVPADGRISVPMKRLMSKVSLSVDRSALSDDVEFHVRRVKVGACPRSALLFSESSVRTEDDTFITGFSKSDGEVTMLNTDIGFGRSGEVSVYLLENMNGDLLPPDTDDGDRHFAEGDPMAARCSYIEIEADYVSDTHFSTAEEPLVWRFYLGEDNGNFDVRRNCHYKVCVKPEDDGLSDDGWRIEKGGLGTYISSIRLSYDALRFSYMGESAVLRAYVTPEEATVRELEWESDNSAVAEVSATGAVTAMGEGTCTIRCSATDGSGEYAVCEVEVAFSPYYMKIYPGNFIRGKTGDEIHVFCEYFPPTTPFDIGLEELEYDSSRGIYDYRVDDDGKGVRLRLKNPGSGLLYMETGYPISQSEMIMIVVD